MQRLMPVLQTPRDYDIGVETNSCEDLTPRDRSRLCEKRSTTSSLDTIRLGYQDGTLLNRAGSDFLLHTRLGGTRYLIYNRSLHLSKKGAYNFSL